jgi:hypothetical protein
VRFCCGQPHGERQCGGSPSQRSASVLWSIASRASRSAIRAATSAALGSSQGGAERLRRELLLARDGISPLDDLAGGLTHIPSRYAQMGSVAPAYEPADYLPRIFGKARSRMSSNVCAVPLLFDARPCAGCRSSAAVVKKRRFSGRSARLSTPAHPFERTVTTCVWGQWNVRRCGRCAARARGAYGSGSVS